MENVQDKIERLEEQARRTADELDVVKAKAQEATKLEATKEKYKKKLDETSVAVQRLKEVEEKNSKYLDQVCRVRWGFRTVLSQM